MRGRDFTVALGTQPHTDARTRGRCCVERDSYDTCKEQAGSAAASCSRATTLAQVHLHTCIPVSDGQIGRGRGIKECRPTALPLPAPGSPRRVRGQAGRRPYAARVVLHQGCSQPL